MWTTQIYSDRKTAKTIKISINTAAEYLAIISLVFSPSYLNNLFFASLNLGCISSSHGDWVLGTIFYPN